MNNPVFVDALATLRAVLATVEAEVGRQAEIEAKISAVKASLLNLESLEKEARGRQATIEGDVQLAQRKYSEAQQTAQKILTDAREQARSLKDKAMAEAEETAARLVETAIAEAREAVRKRRGASA